MARPWKHPKTGMYWLRKRVPVDLIAILDKREVKKSLATRDPNEARKRHAKELTKLEKQWEELRSAPPRVTERALTEREAQEMVQGVHDCWLEQHRDNPSKQDFWPTRLAERLWGGPPPAPRANGYNWPIPALYTPPDPDEALIVFKGLESIKRDTDVLIEFDRPLEHVEASAKRSARVALDQSSSQLLPVEQLQPRPLERPLF